MSWASYVAEMNLSASISRSNWWQLACWSINDFITEPSHMWPNESVPQIKQTNKHNKKIITNFKQ